MTKSKKDKDKCLNTIIEKHEKLFYEKEDNITLKKNVKTETTTIQSQNKTTIRKIEISTVEKIEDSSLTEDDTKVKEDSDYVDSLENMVIFIEDINGETFPFKVESNERIIDLKLKIENRWDIKPGYGRLIFGGRQLEDGLTLADYNIHNESSIYFVLTLS